MFLRHRQLNQAKIVFRCLQLSPDRSKLLKARDPLRVGTTERISKSDKLTVPRRATVMHIGRMHQHVQDQPLRVDHQMALAAGDPLATIVAALAPASLKRAVWLSMIAACGSGLRPARIRALVRRTSLMDRHVPRWRYRRK